MVNDPKLNATPEQQAAIQKYYRDQDVALNEGLAEFGRLYWRYGREAAEEIAPAMTRHLNEWQKAHPVLGHAIEKAADLYQNYFYKMTPEQRAETAMRPLGSKPEGPSTTARGTG